MTVVEELPALTGSPLLDPWRLRARLERAGALEPPPRRQGETLFERILWGLLEDEAPGWHREYATGPYLPDFYCPLARLAVEVDGGRHYGREAAERDAHRDEWHRLRGITTKRFSAGEVEREAAWVLGDVQRLVRERTGQEAVEQEAEPVGTASRDEDELGLSLSEADDVEAGLSTRVCRSPATPPSRSRRRRTWRRPSRPPAATSCPRSGVF